MPLTPELLSTRKKAVQTNKESLGLRRAGIDSKAPITDIRSLYGSEPAQPGTQATVSPIPTTTPKPTIADAVAKVTPFDIANAQYNEDPALSAYGAFNKGEAYNPDGSIKTVDPKQTYEDTRKNFQAQIDAVNAVYQQKLAEASRIGEGRLGTGRAIQARSGTLGSDFAAAQTNNISGYNTGINNGILAEQNAATTAIEQQIRTDATASIKAKTDAIRAGAGEYITYLNNRTVDQENKAKSLIKSLSNSGVTLDQISKEDIAKIASSYGLSNDAIANLFADSEAEKAAAEAASTKATLDNAKTLSEIDKNTADSTATLSKGDLDAANARLKQLEVENFGKPPRPGTKDYAEYAKLLAETDKIGADIDKSAAEINNINADTGLKYANTDKAYTEADKARKEVSSDYGLSGKALTTFNSIANKYTADELIKASAKTVPLQRSIDAVRNNPTGGVNQLAVIYGTIKALDLYDSAVREGEIGLAQNTQSFIDKYKTNVDRINSGQIISAQAILEMADAAEGLIGGVNEIAQRREQQFASQARVSGLEGPWNDYRSGFETTYDTPKVQLTPLSATQSFANPILNKYPYQEVQDFLNQFPDATEDEIRQGLEEAGVDFNQEGSDSNAQAVIGKAQPAPITLAVAKKYPVDSTGGQCTTFLHKIADFPPIGDGKNQKFASVDKYGYRKEDWEPKLGDIIVTDDNETYGHTMMLTKILPGNKGQVTDSNWKGNEKVSHSRIVNLSGNNIYGAIRPKRLKIQIA